MNILITGCNGQLGNEIQRLQQKYTQHQWFNTDVADLDITNQSAVELYIQQHQIDGIINCAAYTAVDKAETEMSICTAINTNAPAHLAQAIAQRGGWIVHVSTDYVFDGTAHTPYVETDTPCPNSVYGNTKLAGEQAVQKHCPNAMIIRTAWLYSTFGNNFVKTMIRLGKEKEELGVIYDQIGSPTYARDLATIILTAIEQGIVPGIYHFSNEGVSSWYDFTKAIHRLAKINTCKVKPLRTDQYPTPAKRPAYSVLDKTKLKNTYKIEIPYWEDSLRDCIDQLAQ